MEDERLSVQVHYHGTETYADLAPMVDELESMFGSIALTVSRPRPPAAGGAFSIALALTVDIDTLIAASAVVDLISRGAATIAKAFLEELGKEGAKAFREKLLKIPVLNPVSRKDLSPNGLSIVIGTVQFYIDTPMTEQELASALQKAAELVAKMPEDRFNNPSGGSGWPIIWDAHNQSWNDPPNQSWKDAPNPDPHRVAPPSMKGRPPRE